MKGESWITIASTDIEAWEAIVLANSLKRTYTTKNTTILINHGVSESIRFLLQKDFDLVSNIDCQGKELIAWCWTLNCWGKCVFIKPNSIVLHNIDDVFNDENTGPQLHGFNSYFTLKPNYETFRELKNLANDQTIDNLPNTIISEFGKKKHEALFNKNNKNGMANKGEMDVESMDLMLQTGNLRIIEYPQSIWLGKNGTSKIDTLSKTKLMKLWAEIFVHDVLPQIDNEKDEFLQKQLKKSIKKYELPLTNGITSSPPAAHLGELEDAVAVIGMSCRFPGANNPDEFWELLKNGIDPMSKFPQHRPSPTHSMDDEISNFEAGFLKCAVDEFDAKFFGISPREAPFVDPQQRILLEVIWESLENSYINPQDLKDTNTGVFLGIWQQDYAHLLPKNIGLNTNDLHHRYLGNAFSATASRISHFIGMFGPNYSIESGCSSSSAGVHLACESLKHHETDLTIACGVNLILVVVNPFSEDNENSIILSKDHRCKTFDESANGFARAEGCGSLVLKRYVDAKRDGDNILGLIRGTALNNDGPGTSFGTPNAIAQERVIREALKNASVLPKDVSYVEAHGTGTAVGDPTEMWAIGQVYSTDRDPKDTLLVSSVKSNIGHAEACAGLAGLIKVILAMKHNQIPPHLHLKTLNPRINLEEIPAKIPTELTPWENNRNNAKLAGISSFSMSGTNVHVVLQQEPLALTEGNSKFASLTNCKYELIQISAKSEEALEAQRKSYIKFLNDQNGNIDLHDLAYCTNVGRASFQHRIAVLGKTVGDVLESLEKRSFITGRIPTTSNNQNPKICFLFSGQGSQYFGMGQELYKTFPIFRAYFDRCCKAWEAMEDVSDVQLKDIMWNSSEYLEQAIFCQPAIFCIQYAIFNLWRSFGIVPDLVLGHSVGEFCASVAAGVLSFQEALFLVIKRSKLVQAHAESGSMLAVKTSYKSVQELISRFETEEKWIDIAAINSEEEVVVSGTLENIKHFRDLCNNNGFKTQDINSSHAFHSRSMDTVLKSFGKNVSLCSPKAPKITYISGTLGKILTEPSEFEPSYWQGHLRNPVQFSEAIKIALAETKIMIEIGSKPILLSLAMCNITNNPTASETPAEETPITFCPSIRNTEEESLTVMTSLSKLYIAGLKINWKTSWFGKRFPKPKIALPTYSFNRKKYWYETDDEENSLIEPFAGLRSENTKVLHPLVGNTLSAPIHDSIFTSVLRLQNHNGQLKLTNKNLTFLEDHRVVDRLIVPGAGFLDMIMFTGKSILTSGNTKMDVPFSIDNFMVEAALELNKSSVIQTISKSATNSQDEGIKYSISIYKQLDATNWKRHASGTFNPSTKIPPIEKIELEELFTKFKAQDPAKIESAYNKIRELGIDFGPKFQSIEAVWIRDGDANSQKSYLVKIKQPTISEHDKYICHPIILDAMIQASAFKNLITSTPEELKNMKHMLLPISIQKLTWLSKSWNGQDLYALLQGSSNKVELYSGAGEGIGIMEGLELVKVSKDSFIRALDAEREVLPTFLEESWKPVFSTTRSRVDTSLFTMPTDDTFYMSKLRDEITEIKDQATIEVDITNHSFFLYLARGVQEVNWPWPEVGGTLLPAQWKDKSSSKYLQNIKMYQYFMEAFVQQGYLEKHAKKEDAYVVVKNLPSLESIEKELQSFNSMAEENKLDKVSFQYSKRCGKHFTNLLKGEMSPLDYMFPSDPNEVGGLRFFRDSYLYQNLSNLLIGMTLDSLENFAKTGGNNGILRILEVGAGSGKTSGYLMDELNRLGIPFQFTFTDVSPLFISEAQNTVLKDYKNINYSLYNIEEDPLNQGFTTNSFDIILAAQVLHATANIQTALGHLQSLLRNNGFLVLSEQFTSEYFITLSFGFLDGWWRFDDFRKHTPLLSVEKWIEIFESTGFKNPISFSGLTYRCGGVIGQKVENENNLQLAINSEQLLQLPTWLVFTDETELSKELEMRLAVANRRTVVMLNRDTENLNQISYTEIHINYKSKPQFETFFEELGTNSTHIEGILYMWTNPAEIANNLAGVQETNTGALLLICQLLMGKTQDLQMKKKKYNPARIYVLTRGLYYIGDCNPGNPSVATSWGLLRSFLNENPEYHINLIDLDQDFDSSSSSSYEAEEVFTQFWNFKDKEYFLALKEGKKYVPRLLKQEKKVHAIVMPNSDRFKIRNPENGNFEDLIALSCSNEEVNEDKIEIAIEATAMNFRDLFMVLKPEGFDIPVGTADLGLDIAGIVTKIGPKVTKFQPGDAVFGFTNTNGFASHVVITEKAVIKKPDDMTFTAAATIPCAFLTVVSSLVHYAKIQKFERVLIHVATGGVGLAAIQVAKYYNAEIFATAGSKKKRNYLRKSLGIKYVYHSRNTDFGDEILRDTNGEGVNIVLNSLTGPGFKEASLKACAPNARFLEIGKMQIWTPEELKALRPDVEYFIIDLAAKSQEDPKELEKYFTNVEEEFKTGNYIGLPHVTFPFELIREAFYYFQKAKHIGKIVVKIPKFSRSQDGKFLFKHEIFNKESTYLITGGLGGIGMEIAKWMLHSGANTLVLIGRSLPSQKTTEILKHIVQSSGQRLIVLQGDIGNYAQCEKILEMIISLKLPPLRGIMHAAGVISDSLILNQNWESYTKTYTPKVYGGWNLHLLTYNYDLEFFSMFSSGVGLIGTPGQSNHAGANLFLDSLAHYRLSLGLTANTVNWGAWSDVGAAAHIQIGQEGGLGFRSFTPRQGILSMEKILREHHLQTVVVSVPNWNTVKQFIHCGNLMDELHSKDDSLANSGFSEKHKKMIEDIKAAAPCDKQAILEQYMEVVLKETLRIPENESLDHDQDFSEMGVDSLMGMEMRNKLQSLLPSERSITVSAVQENRTIRKLSAHIAYLMNTEEEEQLNGKSDISSLSTAEIITQDCVLPEDIKTMTEATLAENGHIPSPSEFKNILLTGASGHLGSYIIPELTARSNIEKIYCLVRGSSIEDATSRLHKVLNKHGLMDKVELEKLVVITGDVRKERLGLSEESYNELISEIDGVINCAIKCNHIETYTDGGENSMRTTNVLGIHNILRFAVNKKIKPILHMSALTTITQITPAGIPSEDFPQDPADGIELHSGYILSKFISEYILGQAASVCNIPITVFRLSGIFGSSVTGSIPPGYNHAWNILLACIRVRKFPKFDGSGCPCMAVDNVARITTDLFCSDSKDTGMYNLTYETVLTPDDFSSVMMKFGIEGEYVPQLEWRDLVIEEYGGGPDGVNQAELGPFATLYENERGLDMHPLARHLINAEDNEDKLHIEVNMTTAKVRKNLPNLTDYIVDPKLVLERHLNHYFETLKGKDN